MTSRTESAPGDAPNDGAAADSLPGSLAELRAAYAAADAFAKEVFEFCDDVAIPALNELRYAGHHLLRALRDDGGIADREQLRKALSHCQRSQYEAAEAAIAHALGLVGKFQEDYKLVPIGQAVPNYPSIQKTVRAAQDLVNRPRSNDGPDAAGVLPDAAGYMETFRQLREQYHVLEDARPELAKYMRKDRRTALRFVAAIAIAAVGVIVALLKLLSTW